MASAQQPPRTRTLWTLAIVIIILDQLSKAWFVFRLGNLHPYKSFGEFLPHYWSEFNRSSDANYSIIEAKYYSYLRATDIKVWGEWVRFFLTTNKGAAWSMFDNHSFLLSLVSLLIAALLWVVWRRNFIYHRGMTIAIGLIIGGALGNFIDRFRLQEVVDFIAVRIPLIGRIFPSLGDPYPFPIFNVADASAVCGTLALAGYLLYLDLTAGKRKKLKQQQHDEELRRAFKPYDPRDEEAIERAHHVDTSSVPLWTESERKIAAEQAEVSAVRAEQVQAEETAAQRPELTAEYQPTASAIEVTKQEAEATSGGTGVTARDEGIETGPDA